MKRILFVMLCLVSIGMGCTTSNQKKTESTTVIEMEMTKDYSPVDPFVNARLFQIGEDLDALDVQIVFQMEGETGVLEFHDHDTREVLWEDTFYGNVAETTIPIKLHDLKKEKEYTIQFTGTKILYASIHIKSDHPSFQELARPKYSDR